MRLTICFLAFFVTTTLACEHSRTPGLFRHGFTSTEGTDNFVADTGSDTTNAYGGFDDVTFGNNINIYGDDFDKVKICDNGMLMFYTGTTPTCIEYNKNTSPFSRTNQAFAAALWFDEQGGTDYEFTYKHIKASDIESTAGSDIGPSKCYLERVENIVGDCTDNGYRTNTKEIKEALFVTWQIERSGTKYYFQTVVAVDSTAQTAVIFLYENPTNIPSGVDYASGYITGLTTTLATSSSLNAGVCPFTSESIASGSKLHEQSNCRCGKWNEGIYVFKTETAAQCGKSEANFATECNKVVTTDNTENMNIACRPARNLQDTCLEHVYCVDKDNGDREINIKVINPPFEGNTALVFVESTQFDSGTVQENTNGFCRLSLTQEGSTDVYGKTQTFSQAELSTCYMTENAGDISFVARIYDNRNAEYEQAGDIYLKATCDILPFETSVDVEHNSIAEYAIPTVTGRALDMIVTYTKIYENGVDRKVPQTAQVPLGEHLYLTIRYEWGNRVVVDKVEPYGIYAKDCKVSNNAGFVTTGTNRVDQLITADTGCVNTALTSSDAFYIAEAFKIALRKDPSTIDMISNADTSVFNYVISTGKLDAAKWLVGGSDIIYFRCTVGFCFNQDYKTESECWDTCAKTGTDYAGRKRRDVNGTNENRYPDVTVQTSVRVYRPEENGSTQPVECVSNVVAYSTLLALTVLLLVAMGVTLMLFVRLQTRQRKRM